MFLAVSNETPQIVTLLCREIVVLQYRRWHYSIKEYIATPSVTQQVITGQGKLLSSILVSVPALIPNLKFPQKSEKHGVVPGGIFDTRGQPKPLAVLYRYSDWPLQ